jgi:transposase
MVNLHQTGISQTDIRVLKKVGTATIERWYHELLGRKNREFLSYRYSSHIGIDEHRFSKKVGFSTTLCDLKNNRVLDITKGRSAKEIVPTLKRIPGREQVKMVSLDLSETYRAVAKEVFPNAVLVADRFHVIRLVNQHFLDTWKLLDPSGRHNRGLLSLMRRHAWHLKDSQKLNLDSYLSAFPGLKSIYDFKQDLVRLLLIKHRSKPQCKPLIRLLLSATAQLRNAHFDPLVTLGYTLHNWQSEIAAMWRFTKSNAITEGFHRKMKLIQRRAYGFKNFENYRLRVRVLCSSMNFVFT